MQTDVQCLLVGVPEGESPESLVGGFSASFTAGPSGGSAQLSAIITLKKPKPKKRKPG